MSTLAAISLIAPVMLAGGVLIALPIVAHLLHRNARRPVVFPSIRLLRASSANQSSLFRLRRRLLLLLRALAVALLALAFAEPLWSGSSDTEESTGGTTVVVLDASASTRRADGATSVFERLRGDAARIIEGLEGGRDQAEVIVADDLPQGLVGALTPNLTLLTDLLRDARPGDARADLRAALRLAGQLLAEAPPPHRVVIATDGQATNWMDLVEATSAEAMGFLPTGTAIDVTAIPASGANVGVETRGMSQRRAAPGQPIAARVRVHAFEADARVTLRLVVDGATVERRDVEVAAGRPRDESFMVSVDGDGPHAVEIAADHDALRSDDAAFATFDVGRRQPIAILSDESLGDTSRGTYFLARALAPYGDARDRFAPRTIALADFGPAAIADVRTIFVGDLSRMGAAHVAALKGHLGRGGSVVWFCGGGSLAENLAAMEEAMPGLLPFRPSLPSDREGRLIGGSGRRSLLASFDEAAFIGLGQIRIGRIRPCTVVRDDATQVLTFDDATPALSLRRYGEGAFAMANFSPAPKAGDLGRHGAFVALVQSLATELEMSDGAFRPTYVGEPISIVCDGLGPEDRSSMRLVGPDGEAIPGAIVLEDRTETSITLQRSLRSGFHRAVRGESTIAIGAVNADPRESDPRTFDAEAIRTLAGVLVETASPGTGTVTPASKGALMASGTPIWWMAILAALAAFGSELALLAWWRR
ncbi:MAG: BatA and WFA domain-containing protein [Phycisphaerae bacterium]|nr:BatA and WFA domain-containing protein [Phycisphaerae bacterium]